MNALILDVASAPIEGAAAYIGDVKAPSNYKDPEKIAAYIAEEQTRRVEMAATDMDLARLTAIGTCTIDEPTPVIQLCRDEHDEKDALNGLKGVIGGSWPHRSIVTFGGFAFDLQLVQRRSLYLGIKFPKLDLSRWGKSPHVDLLLELSDRDPSRRRSLGFYVKRLGFTDLVKGMTGEEESKVHTSGRWDDLRAAVAHDVEATRRLAAWMGLL